MKAYYCDFCEDIFSEEDAKIIREPDGYGEREVYACPVCHGTEIEEADYCEICGRPIRPGQTYCEKCLDEVHKAWAAVVDKVAELRSESKKSMDFLDCESAAIEFLQEIGVI